MDLSYVHMFLSQKLIDPSYTDFMTCQAILGYLMQTRVKPLIFKKDKGKGLHPWKITAFSDSSY